MSPNLFPFDISASKTVVVVCAVLIVAALDLLGRSRRDHARYPLGVIVGTVLSLGLIKACQALFAADMSGRGPVLAIGVFFIVIAWRLLFGNWDSRTKATVLGTFIFWIFFHVLAGESPQDRLAHFIAIGVAIIPAVVWCMLFLPYHRERLSVVALMVFAGMLSTIPILFYDALVRHGAELHFILFRITPEGFAAGANTIVSSYATGIGPLQASLLSMLISFIFVGVIEEGSKFWALKNAGRGFATSIDDVLQMGVLVGIGFAFAENVTNTGYFLSFVREYLLNPEHRDWVAFLGNVAGRSILTSMVHIVSTGIMAYYLGLAMFAGPMLREKQSSGIRYRLLEWCHEILGLEKRDLYRRMKLLTGYAFAVMLHAMSNFLVSLPDALPGNPRTLGDLLHSGPSSPLRFVALLLAPTLFYVVGGFTILTALFQRKENMKERGHLVDVEAVAA